MTLFPLPNLENSTTFPLPEANNLEFKSGFYAAEENKIIATICGILNIGGGYLIIGVEDTKRNIVGIKTDKHMDKFLLMIDSIYHNNKIKKTDTTSIEISTITSNIISCANNKQILVIAMKSELNKTYCINNGSIWYRLLASNYRKTSIERIYSQNEIQDMVEKNKQLQSECDKLKIKFMELEKDFNNIIGAAKEHEILANKYQQKFNEFESMLYNNILLQKIETENVLSSKSKSWLDYICCFKLSSFV
jgi:predicted HTH transcriptional regulator